MYYADYRTTSPYGPRKSPITGKSEFHTGIDLVKSSDKNIYAFASGTVMFADLGKSGSGFGGFGNVVAIKDAQGSLHCYCHLSKINVTVGQKISKGDLIGIEGSTGKSTGSHLHYEIRTKTNPSYGFGNHTDPSAYLDDLYPSAQYAKSINVIYGAHVADLGWLPDVKNDSDYAGTVGQKRRVEAVEIRLENAPVGASIEYQVHVADKGWLPIVANGAVAGTTGQARRVEAIRIWIKNLPNYTVEYRVHMKDKGWSSWMRDGEIAGTVGEKRRIEAIQIRLKVV